MPREVLRIGVVARSHRPANVWAVRVLQPVAVLADWPPLTPGTLMREEAGVQTFWMGDHALTLHHGETKHYRDNLASARPSVWVALDGERVLAVTVDPYEGEGLASDSERVVEALEMPESILKRVVAFVATHHVEEPFIKRKRVPAAMGGASRAPRVLRPEDKGVRR